jgi:hypothetical protein
VFLAGVDDPPRRIEHDLVLVLARMAEFLAEIAFANQHGGDSGYIFQHVGQVGDTRRLLMSIPYASEQGIISARQGNLA